MYQYEFSGLNAYTVNLSTYYHELNTRCFYCNKIFALRVDQVYCINNVQIIYKYISCYYYYRLC